MNLFIILFPVVVQVRVSNRHLPLLFEGVEELTKWLQENGIKMAVATSSRSDALPPKVENHKEMFDRLEFVVCGDDPEVHRQIVQLCD